MQINGMRNETILKQSKVFARGFVYLKFSALANELDVYPRSPIVTCFPALFVGYMFYYINSSEMPGELSSENMISSHVKILTYYLHM